jgi:hypothetical protein
MPMTRSPRDRDAAFPFRGYLLPGSDAGAAAGVPPQAREVLRQVAFVLHLSRGVRAALLAGGAVPRQGRSDP